MKSLRWFFLCQRESRGEAGLSPPPQLHDASLLKISCDAFVIFYFELIFKVLLFDARLRKKHLCFGFSPESMPPPPSGTLSSKTSARAILRGLGGWRGPPGGSWLLSQSVQTNPSLLPVPLIRQSATVLASLHYYL